ncbi:restriction endonuclease subunit S [Raoultibacter phocaeensis]|uniref:restriction endonuclease subunit S n=1 Tax=Raoultibacter phocaeensis TaxID=2479841 RepID=UPI001118B15D|nr:restriction endonuclease subunit S [Raoultibacter phocaeensis]
MFFAFGSLSHKSVKCICWGTPAWEQRKLGDFLTLSRTPGHTGANAKKLTVKLWGKGVVGKADSYTGSEQTQYYVRRSGQFMYGKLDFLHAAFGIVPDKLDGYESTLDSPAFDIASIDSRFLLDSVTQEDFYLRHGMIANGGRKAKRIHEDVFLSMPILVPTEQEQTQIGAFFRSLDGLITLHQRKQDELHSHAFGQIPIACAPCKTQKSKLLCGIWNDRVGFSELVIMASNLFSPIKHLAV